LVSVEMSAGFQTPEEGVVKMNKSTVSILGGGMALLLSGLIVTRAQDVGAVAKVEGGGGEVVEHPECSYFANRNKYQPVNPTSDPQAQYQRSALTVQVSSKLGPASGKAAKSFQNVDNLGTIDKYLYADMNAAGVVPADQTTDWEFIRRVTLDLTGRIPAPDRVLSFVADKAPDKRAKLIDDLLAKPEWIDKWTMYFGDLYSNTSRNTFVVRYEPGRNAFYKWIKDSLTANKPYNQMATELISASGENSWTQGELNWLVGAWVIGNPQQDNIDQEAANVAQTFLGISHMNCLLCHNGRGHLDALSLWGSGMTRTQAWGFSSFLSHAITGRTPVPNAINNQPYYWYVRDDPPKIQDYTLNTTTGNRPSRQPIGTQKTVPPLYPFTGDKPAAGENYRAAMARIVTSDIQFARAAVNYIWAQFFGRGIVDPVDQFDPARLDPDNPPADPWTLQPSNARLLNAMAQEFVDDGYDLKTLMRKIANSEAYQLSARYNGNWNSAWEPLFARKMVRRLWPEEIHDAVVLSSGVIPNNGASYNLVNFSYFPDGSLFAGYPTYGPFTWAMQAPDVVNTPDNGGPVSLFMDSFFRGNRDLEERRSDGSVLQALSLMNDPFITSRVDLTRATKNGLLNRYLAAPVDQLINNFYLAVLSRYPSDDEMQTALKQFPKGQTAVGAENLLWTLYNKVDFVFNY
jgi:Protein of unknown function (DUF1549)/Protein of unknown function (DUF1553)